MSTIASQKVKDNSDPQPNILSLSGTSLQVSLKINSSSSLLSSYWHHAHLHYTK